MKLRHIVTLFVCVLGCCILRGQTLEEAKKLYLEERFAEALPIFQTEYLINPTDASLNQWLGVCLYETGNESAAEKHLVYASQKKIQKHTSIWGTYTKMYRFDEAEKEFENIGK